MFNVISTGSKGNAVIYHDTILIDCGVTYALIEPFLKGLSIVLLTHKHKDHININTLKKMQFNKPSLRIGCPPHMIPVFDGYGLRNIDIYNNIGQVYDYEVFKLSTIKLYHDVENVGYRIFKGNHKLIHCTDTAHLEGITAKNYDLYAIEHNYDEETIDDLIKRKNENGQFSYETGAINTHLSEQQAREFIFKNMNENSKTLRLHE